MTTPQEVTISEGAAKVILRVIQQVNIPSAQGKMQLGMAQMELEKAIEGMSKEAVTNAP